MLTQDQYNKLGDPTGEKSDDGQEIRFGDFVQIGGSQRMQGLYYGGGVVLSKESIEYIKERRESRTCIIVKKYNAD